jgi:hypothetical protein
MRTAVVACRRRHPVTKRRHSNLTAAAIQRDALRQLCDLSALCRRRFAAQPFVTSPMSCMVRATSTLISCKARMTIATDSIGGHMREADEIPAGAAGSSQRARRPAASPFVCLLNMSDRHVNLVLGPETHNRADKTSGMRAMTRTNRGTGPFALILRTIKSAPGRYWND